MPKSLEMIRVDPDLPRSGNHAVVSVRVFFGFPRVGGSPGRTHRSSFMMYVVRDLGLKFVGRRFVSSKQAGVCDLCEPEGLRSSSCCGCVTSAGFCDRHALSWGHFPS